MMNNSTM